MNFLKKNYGVTHFNIAGLKKQLRTISAVLILLFITQSTFAQQGINYKAVIKDASGNVMANQNITVQFSILQNTTNVYTETHTPTTDDNGIVILNIGEGTVVNGDYATIDWGSDTHFLNIQIDSGAGLVDLGTTQFKAVPYALQAANVTGLEKITENGNTGWRLLGQNPANYGPIGADAIDLSTNTTVPSTTRGATGIRSIAMGSSTTASGSRSTAMGQNTTASGFRSTAMGESTTASGSYSTAMGNTTTASGDRSIAMGSQTTASAYSSTAMGASTTASGRASTAMGENTTASGSYSTAMGNTTTASGDRSTAMGSNTIAKAFSSTAIGRYNVGGGSGTTWVNTDKLFEIGIGDSDTNRKNALTVLKNGIITAPGFDISEITDSKALITKEYLEANAGTVATGLEKITENGNTGWRLIGQTPSNYGTIGTKAIDLSTSTASSTTKGATGLRSTAMGENTTASGNGSTAMGEDTTASGSNSIAMGNNTTASGSGSTVMGENTTASGHLSTAMGSSTTASGSRSTAMGSVTTASGFASTAMGIISRAQAYASTAMGRYNVGGGSGTTWVTTDKLFEIGIGNSDTNRKNALTVLKNGKVGISTANPDTKLHITNGVDASLNNGTGYIVLGDLAGRNTVFDENEIIARDNGANSTLYLQQDGGDVNVGGSVVHASDRRLKKDITTLPYGLKEVLQLQPKVYHWKNRVQKHRSLGLIAQEVQPLIKEIVQTANDANKTLSINYTALIPVLINAIKEQQDIINNLQSMVGSQQSKINLLMTVTSQKAVDDRIEQLESKLKPTQP